MDASREHYFPLLLFSSSIALSLLAAQQTRSRTRNTSTCTTISRHARSNKFKVVALDLDGTTLNTNHKLSQVTVDKLRSLSAKGIQISIATGRSFGAVMDTLGELQLGVEVPVVCLNGAMCIKVSKDVQRIDKVFDALVSPASAAKLLAFAASQGLVAQYYIESNVYAAPKTEQHNEFLERYSTLTGKKQHIVPDYSKPLAIAPAAKILLMTDDADGLIAEATKRGYDQEFHLIKGSPYPFFVEFLGTCMHCLPNNPLSRS